MKVPTYVDLHDSFEGAFLTRMERGHYKACGSGLKCIETMCVNNYRYDVFAFLFSFPPSFWHLNS